MCQFSYSVESNYLRNESRNNGKYKLSSKKHLLAIFWFHDIPTQATQKKYTEFFNTITLRSSIIDLKIIKVSFGVFLCPQTYLTSLIILIVGFNEKLVVKKSSYSFG